MAFRSWRRRRLRRSPRSSRWRSSHPTCLRRPSTLRWMCCRRSSRSPRCRTQHPRRRHRMLHRCQLRSRRQRRRHSSWRCWFRRGSHWRCRCPSRRCRRWLRHLLLRRSRCCRTLCRATVAGPLRGAHYRSRCFRCERCRLRRCRRRFSGGSRRRPRRCSRSRCRYRRSRRWPCHLCCRRPNGRWHRLRRTWRHRTRCARCCRRCRRLRCCRHRRPVAAGRPAVRRRVTDRVRRVATVFPPSPPEALQPACWQVSADPPVAFPPSALLELRTSPPTPAALPPSA